MPNFSPCHYIEKCSFDSNIPTIGSTDTIWNVKDDNDFFGDDSSSFVASSATTNGADRYQDGTELQPNVDRLAYRSDDPYGFAHEIRRSNEVLVN